MAVKSKPSTKSLDSCAQEKATAYSRSWHAHTGKNTGLSQECGANKPAGCAAPASPLNTRVARSTHWRSARMTDPSPCPWETARAECIGAVCVSTRPPWSSWRSATSTVSVYKSNVSDQRPRCCGRHVPPTTKRHVTWPPLWHVVYYLCCAAGVVKSLRYY